MNPTSLPQLYAPSAAEIAHVCESAKHRHPELASRLDKAAEIIRSGGLQLDSVAWEVRNMARWRIASQAHAVTYIVCGFHCPCKDKAAPVVGGIHFCKHNCAIAMYLKILRNRAQVDILRFDVELGVLGNGHFHGYAVRAGYMELYKDGCTYKFADTRSAVFYALWLANKERANKPATVMPSAVAVAA